MTKPSYYLIVERKENWQVDRSANFSFFGLPERYRKAASGVKTGDYLISYISGGVSAFADVRQCIVDGVKPLRHGGDYDSGFPIMLITKPVVALEPDQWVKVHSMVEKLSFLANRNDWRQVFRHTFRTLTPADASIIETEIRTAAAHLRHP